MLVKKMEKKVSMGAQKDFCAGNSRFIKFN